VGILKRRREQEHIKKSQWSREGQKKAVTYGHIGKRGREKAAQNTLIQLESAAASATSWSSKERKSLKKGAYLVIRIESRGMKRAWGGFKLNPFGFFKRHANIRSRGSVGVGGNTRESSHGKTRRRGLTREANFQQLFFQSVGKVRRRRREKVHVLSESGWAKRSQI